MPTIFELFGHRLDDLSPEAQADRAQARCPFMGRDCDGGGNRKMSTIQLNALPPDSPLKAMYPDRQTLKVGVCSIQPAPTEPPWVVCPRRLLIFHQLGRGEQVPQHEMQQHIMRLLPYPHGTTLGVWSEVSIWYAGQGEVVDRSTGTSRQVRKTFDYTFDYVLLPIATVEITAEKRKSTRQPYERTVSADKVYVVDVPDPAGVPSIIEVMTCSTSGGNKQKRSTITNAFEDALLGKPHVAPSINYRQVWARMASQLLVKSEVAKGWGGIVLWIVQDVLAHYITTSTGLMMEQFWTDHIEEVNILSMSFGDFSEQSQTSTIALSEPRLYSGPIDHGTASFADIIRAPIHPPLSKLLTVLNERKWESKFTIP